MTAATGPNTDLHLYGETGAALGASLDPSQPVASGQQDLVVVTLPLQHVDQLNAFLQAVSNPYSPSYAHFLTDEQFTNSYSPAASDQQAVANYLASNGLVLKYVSPDHLTVAASGSLLQLEKAFSVQFATYHKNGQTFFAPTASPSVPSSLAPWIENVAGLTSFNFDLQPQVVLNTGTTSHTDVATAGSGVEDYPNQNTYEFQLNQLWNATGNHSAGVVPSFAKGVVIATGLWDLNNSPSPAPQYCPVLHHRRERFLPGAHRHPGEHALGTAGPDRPRQLQCHRRHDPGTGHGGLCGGAHRPAADHRDRGARL